MNIISIVRDVHQDGQQTKGVLLVMSPNFEVLFRCYTLELPWRNNERRISCIPAGTYEITHRTSQRFGHHLHLQDVPGRTFILIHQGNFVSQIEGCILVGERRLDINGDGLADVTSSVATMRRLMELIPQKSKIIISWHKDNPELNG